MVTGAYHPEISSSALQCRDMARVLAGRAEVRVLTTAVDQNLRAKDRVDDVAVSRVLVDVTSRPSKLSASVRMMAALLQLIPWCDVIHIHGFSKKNVIVAAVAKMFGRPIVMSLHTSGHDDAGTIRQHSPMAWWAFRQPALYLSVSPGLVDGYLAAGLSPERIRLVPNGIDTQRFSPADASERRELRRQLGLPADKPIVLFVGFFSHDKQPRIAFDAWKSLHTRHGIDATLLFVGATTSPYFEVDQNLSERMREEAAAEGRGADLIFTGMMHNVQDFFRAADVFVLPSRREGLPVALLEAMACGLPCVASRLPGATDIIITSGVNGLLVPPGDVSAMAGHLAEILRAPSLAAALGRAARDTVAGRFANTDVAGQWLDAYHSVRDRAR
jgi:glycosyltransferase involved in cell wall biosynthesis